MTMTDTLASPRRVTQGTMSLKSKRSSTRRVFLATHYGAGQHSKNKEEVYRKLSETACRKGLKVLNNNGSADDAVVEVMVVLENSKKLNAGMGSHLTMDKTVELDAGFMSGNGRFGGIGAVPGLPNPCLAAKALANLKPGVLVPPNLLVGTAANTWAGSVGLKTCNSDDLICKRAQRVYKRYLENQNLTSLETESDTIGCIALDSTGHVAASGSTGGGLYKMSGRVGPIAQYGCGVFARDHSTSCPLATAIAATGTGEYLTELRFAATCDNYIRNDDCLNPITAMTKVMDSVVGKRMLGSTHKAPIAGMIGLTWNGNRGEFVVSHNSDNLVYAYTGSMFGNKIHMKYSEKSEDRNYKLQVFNV